MFKKKRYIFLMLVILLIAIWQAAKAYQNYKLGPKPNPNPKYFVTITGNIEPNMPNPQTLVFRATYGAYRPSCHVWISRFAGVSGIKGHVVYYPVHPNAKGDYKVQIPIDAYKPGKCDWKIAWVMFTNTGKHLPPRWDWGDDLFFGDMISFAHYPSDPNGIAGYPSSTNATMYCAKKFDPNIGCPGTSLIGGYANFSVPRNRSYHFIQNIKPLSEEKKQ